jgi:hypothetical protein
MTTKAETKEAVVAIRENVCMAVEDLGGVLTRLRELDDQDYPLPDAWEDVSAWLNQAAAVLQSAALLALNREEQG